MISNSETRISKHETISNHPNRNIQKLLAGFAAVMSIVAFISATEAAEQSSAWEWSGVSRIVAIGDVHGAYGKFVSLLHSTGLVDTRLSWIGGDNHLVMVGDLIDRGEKERAVLDLIRRLENEAEAQGGRVHVLLGNHEVMNMTRDLRYVPESGFKDFSKDENAARRQKGRNAFRKVYGRGHIDEFDFNRAFIKRYPSGYFGRMDAFDIEGEYGAWLLNKPAVIKVNGVLFVHGGLTAKVAALGLNRINEEFHGSLRAVMEASQVLESKVSGVATFASVYRYADKAAKKGSGKSDKYSEAARKFVNNIDGLPFESSGPLWYRGNSLENERIEKFELDPVLESLQARAIVVAHTPTGFGVITSRFNNRVFRVDVGMAYGRKPLALVFEGDEIQVMTATALAANLPHKEPEKGEGFSDISLQLSDKMVEDFLQQAEIVNRREVVDRERGASAEILELSKDELKMRAVFFDVDEKAENPDSGKEIYRRYQNQVAAYLLDRHVGINLVPVTVIREIDGRKGMLQPWLESAFDIKQLEENQQLEDVFRRLQDQIERAQKFLAVLDVRDLHPTGKMYIPIEEKIQIAFITTAFSLSGEIGGEFLPETCRPPSADVEYMLSAITANELNGLLGAYITPAQVDALLERMHKLIDYCKASE